MEENVILNHYHQVNEEDMFPPGQLLSKVHNSGVVSVLIVLYGWGDLVNVVLVLHICSTNLQGLLIIK